MGGWGGVRCVLTLEHRFGFLDECQLSQEPVAVRLTSTGVAHPDQVESIGRSNSFSCHMAVCSAHIGWLVGYQRGYGSRLP